MRMSTAAFLMILTTVFLAGCEQTQTTASVDDHGNSFYGRNGVVPLAHALNGSTSNFAMAAPVDSISSSSNTPATSNATPFKQASGSWQWPVNGKVVENFGKSANGTRNEGIVIAAAEGTPIHAAQPGEVAFVGQDTKNYGNIVIVRHPDGDMTSYAHARAIMVSKGQKVDRNTVLGYVGKSGNVKEPQLHFAVREGTKSIDPLSKLPQQVASSGPGASIN